MFMFVTIGMCRSLAQVKLFHAGGASPRRISCVAFCGAGSVITLAAAWAAVQWPTADVRCISFGAPAVGNADFAAAFK